MTLRFKSKEAFRKFNAYRFIHGIPTKHRQKVIIAGKVHRVKHAKPQTRSKINKMLERYI